MKEKKNQSSQCHFQNLVSGFTINIKASHSNFEFVITFWFWFEEESWTRTSRWALCCLQTQIQEMSKTNGALERKELVH